MAFGAKKIKWCGYPMVEKKFQDIYSCFDIKSACDGRQTDKQTDRQTDILRATAYSVPYIAYT